MLPAVKRDFQVELEHILPVINFSNARRLPLSTTVTYNVKHLANYLEQHKPHIYVLQKNPSGGVWMNTTNISDCKVNLKTMELRVKSKIISSLMVCLANAPIDEAILLRLPTVIMQANQGLIHVPYLWRQRVIFYFMF